LNREFKLGQYAGKNEKDSQPQFPKRESPLGYFFTNLSLGSGALEQHYGIMASEIELKKQDQCPFLILQLYHDTIMSPNLGVPRQFLTVLLTNPRKSRPRYIIQMIQEPTYDILHIPEEKSYS
jgi:hypothetical protein